MTEEKKERKPLFTEEQMAELKKFAKVTLASILVFAIGFICSSIGIDETSTETLQIAAQEAVDEEDPHILIDKTKEVGKEVVVKKIKEQITTKVVVTTIGSKVKDFLLDLWPFGKTKENPTAQDTGKVDEPLTPAPAADPPPSTGTTAAPVLATP